MSRMDEKAVADVRKQIGEVMNKQEQKLTFGWRPQQVERQEGEVWEDVDGKKWTKKNGLVQTVTKLDGFKTPWWCPKCGTPLNGHHLKAYKKAGHCHECILKEEMELKKSGKWHDVIVEKGRQIIWLQYEIRYKNYKVITKIFHNQNLFTRITKKS